MSVGSFLTNCAIRKSKQQEREHIRSPTVVKQEVTVVNENEPGTIHERKKHSIFRLKKANNKSLATGVSLVQKHTKVNI